LDDDVIVENLFEVSDNVMMASVRWEAWNVVAL